MSSTSSLRSPVGLLTPKELHSKLSDSQGENLILLDSSWFMPIEPKRFGFKEFRTKRIENAGFWDL
jgi:hypothetical protein